VINIETKHCQEFITYFNLLSEISYTIVSCFYAVSLLRLGKWKNGVHNCENEVDNVGKYAHNKNFNCINCKHVPLFDTGGLLTSIYSI